MSLEAAIKDNTAAVRDLIAALAAGSTKAVKEVSAGTSASKTKADTAPAATKADTPAATASGTVTFDTVATVVNDFIMAHGSVPAKEILTKFGLGRLGEAREDLAKLADVNAAFEAKAAELKATA